MSVVPSVEVGGGACDTMKQLSVMAGVVGVPEHEQTVGCHTRDRDTGLGRGSCVKVQGSPHPTREGAGAQAGKYRGICQVNRKWAMQAGDAELGDLREGRSKPASRGPSMGSDAQLRPYLLTGSTEFLPLVHTCAEGFHPPGILRKWSPRSPRPCEGAPSPQARP